MGTFTDLIGKRVNDVLVNDDKTVIAFRTIEGEYLAYYASGECCNDVWFNHLTCTNALGTGDLFDILRGTEVLGEETKGWVDVKNEDADSYDVIEDAFWSIQTSRGWIDLEVRNTHNGYYGGHVERRRELNEEEIAELKSVRDF